MHIASKENIVKYVNCFYCKKLIREQDVIVYIKNNVAPQDKFLLCEDCYKERVENCQS